jgi:hypothetical protein
MPTINRNGLEDILFNVKGTTIAGVVLLTVPQMNKKVDGAPNPMYGRVQKRTHRTCMLGFIYSNSVNNQRVREDKDADFVPEPRKWGARIEGTCLVEHKGELYLEAKVEKTVETQYLLDGQVVDKSVVDPYLAVRKSSSRQEVDKPVILIDPKLSSIEQLRIYGDLYDVVDDASAATVADVA